jgi:two-component sensor histidine kinase
VAPAWVVEVELAFRAATAWLGLVLATRWIAARVDHEGWTAAAKVVIAGLGLSVLTVAYLNVISTFGVPWGSRTLNAKWFAAGFIALGVWLIIAVALILAWNVALTAKSFAADAIRANWLRAELAQARMSTLTMQLRPHFLFNTLQSIVALIHTDPAAADRMLSGLRELFLRSMSTAESNLTPLVDEIKLLRLYTDIEAVRFGDRLEISIEVDQLSDSASIPHLFLQPLVENSLHHAVAVRGTGRVRVRAYSDPTRKWLILEVGDNGPGRQGRAANAAAGVGLSNTRARLETLYGSNHSLSIEEHDGEGTLVRVRIPLVPVES